MDAIVSFPHKGFFAPDPKLLTNLMIFIRQQSEVENLFVGKTVLVGFSVLIPYIGAFVVTIPVIFVALFQFGHGPEFWTLFAVYLTIQALDGNVLVPILFSEAVNLHPLVIILSVVIFGGFWGFWGVFFAIPLATLVKAVVYAWPNDVVNDDDNTVSS